MTERRQVAEWMKKADLILERAEQVSANSRKLEPEEPDYYSACQTQLEEISEEISALIRAATVEQRYELTRKQQQIRQMQNQMVLKS